MVKLTTWRRRWAVGLPLGLLFCWAHWPTLCRTLQTWRSDPDYSHGFLVLPVALAILMRRDSPKDQSGSRWDLWGLVLIAVAGLMRIAAGRYYVLELEVWSIPVWIAGLVWLIGGWNRFRWALPAIAFLWFAAPLPARFEQALSVPLQRLAAMGSTWVLQTLGQPAAVSGTTILLGSHRLEIEHACSGLRMFLGTGAMAVAFLLLTSPRRGKTILLLALIVPVAVLANVVRIVMTGLLYQLASSSLAQRFAHDLAGLLMVLVAVLSFWLAILLLAAVRSSFHENQQAFLKRVAVWPVLLATLFFAGVIWRRSQLQHVHASLLETASAYEQSQRWGAAATYLEQYLQLAGEDPAVQQRLALVLLKTAQTPAEQRRALAALRTAWKTNIDNLRLGQAVAETALRLRDYGQVVATTEAMLVHPQVSQPQWAQARQHAARWQAQALYDWLTESHDSATHSWSQVVDSLKLALELDPECVEHASRLAVVYREQLKIPSANQRETLADQTIDQLVQRNATSAEAWLVRYLYRNHYRQTKSPDPQLQASIDADLDRALELDQRSPQRNVDILVAVAERLQDQGRVEESVIRFEEARHADPRDVRPYLAISQIWAAKGTPQARRRAVAVLEQGLETLGNAEVTLLFPLIERLVELDQLERAEQYRELAAEVIQRYPEPTRTTFQIQLRHVDAWRLAKRGRFIEAARELAAELETLRGDYTQTCPHYVGQSWANVGQYFRMAGNWQQAAGAYQRAAALDGTWRLEYRWSLARQAELQGNLDDAIEHYQQLATHQENPADAWMQAASTSLRQQLLLPPQLRDWTSFQRAVTAAKPIAGEKTDRLCVLETQRLLINGKTDQARQMLVDARGQFPDSVSICRALALLQARLGDRQAALQAAQQLPCPDNDVTDSILLQRRVLCQLECPDEAADVLRQALMSDAEVNRPVLQVDLARLEMQLGNWNRARDLLNEAAQAAPHDLRVTEAMSHLALCLQDWPLLAQCEARLRLMEGHLGARWQAARIRHVLDQSTGAAETPDEAEESASQLANSPLQLRQRQIATGHVAARRGQYWHAVAHYEEAWEMGLPRIWLAVDLIGLLNELGQTTRAQRYVHEIRRYLSAAEQVIDPALLGLTGESADEAIRLAEAAVQHNPRAESYLRLGRTLVLTAVPGSSTEASRRDRAEQAFAQAVLLEPDNTRPRAAYFRFLVAVKSDPVQSQQVLFDLADREEIAQVSRTFALAQLNESIGNLAEADRLYHEAIDMVDQQHVSAERLVVLQRSAQYFSRRDRALAESCCRRALQIDPDAVGAAQILIDLLLNQRTPEAVAEADRLFELATSGLTSADQVKRLQARILMLAAEVDRKEATSQRQQAVELLRSVAHRTSLDALCLAELNLLQNHSSSAFDELQDVARDLPIDKEPLFHFLRTYDPELQSDARLRQWTEQIHERLEILPDQMFAVLDMQLDVAGARSATLAPGQQILTTRLIDQFVRRALERADSDDLRVSVLASLMSHLLQGGHTESAQALANCFPDLVPAARAAAALATALAMSPPDVLPETTQQALMKQWLADYPQDTELRFSVANLQLMRGDYAKAAQLLRQCLRQDPQHLTTLNNLALALALSREEQLGEAFELLHSAIGHGGRQPLLMDTLAVLYLRRGAPQSAVDVLLAALPDATADGLLFLHLSQAWLELGQADMSRYAFGMARSRNVNLEPLLPTDREVLQQLDRQFKL